MTTQIDHLQAGPAPHTVRIGPAAIGLALLVLGLAIGLVAGRLQQDPTAPAVSAPQAVGAPEAAAKVPTLTWRDDYGTRHPLVQAETPVLTWRDDYGTRHPEARP
jgi:hypothetical protein